MHTTHDRLNIQAIYRQKEGWVFTQRVHSYKEHIVTPTLQSFMEEEGEKCIWLPNGEEGNTCDYQAPLENLWLEWCRIVGRARRQMTTCCLILFVHLYSVDVRERVREGVREWGKWMVGVSISVPEHSCYTISYMYIVHITHSIYNVHLLYNNWSYSGFLWGKMSLV